MPANNYTMEEGMKYSWISPPGSTKKISLAKETLGQEVEDDDDDEDFIIEDLGTATGSKIKPEDVG